MNLNKYFKDVVILLAIVSLLFFNVANWHLGFLNWVLFIALLLRSFTGAYDVLVKFFNFSYRGLRIKILSVFLVLMVLSSWLGLFIAVYKLNALAYALAFFGTGFIFSFFKNWTSQIEIENIPEMYNPQMEVLDEMPSPIFVVLFFLGLVAYAGALLWKDSNIGHLFSPWQVIDPNYIAVFLLIAFISGLMLFTRLKAKVVLFLLSLFLLLQHSYLPLTHALIYGADGWRHLAVENRLMQSLPLTEVKLSADPISLVRSLDPGRLAYGQFWGWGLLFGKILNFDLLSFNAWLMPILWALLLPILLFELGRGLGFNKKESLFLAWLSFAPFALQVSGAFTLPSNLGFLWWLFLLLLILKRLNSPRHEQAVVLTILAVFSFFGYSLYLILFVFSWMVAELLKKKVPMWLLVWPGMLIFPVLEILAGYSLIPKQLNWSAQVYQLFGNLTGWYLATGPRPHDIIAGNIILNQTPSYAFVVNFLTESRFWLVASATIFFILAGWGTLLLIKNKTIIGRWLANLTMAFFGGYIISRYFLSGDKILTRRLDAVLAILFLIALVAALKSIYKKFEYNKKYSAVLIILAVLIFSLAGTAVYSLGPDTETATVEEYKAMGLVWKEEMDKDKHCILADVYPLLTLEALSAKQIVGGGFPIDENFAQPERIELYNKILTAGDEEVLKRASEITGSNECWVVAPTAKINKTEFIKNNSKDFKNFGKIIAWKFKN